MARSHQTITHQSENPWGLPPQEKKNHPVRKEEDLDQLINETKKKLKGFLPGSGGSNNNTIKPTTLAWIIGIGIVIFWLVSGFYTINTKEKGVVLRFGKFTKTTSAGLNYHLPFPIEKVIKLRVTDRYKEEIGYPNNTLRNSFKIQNESRRKEILMLTGDENIVDVNFEVQWQIAHAQHFLFNVYNPKETVRSAAESAMREVIGTTPINDILSEQRETVQLRTKELLQEILDSYQAGIEIKEINMTAVPPSSTIEAENIIVLENGQTRTEKITTTVDQAFKDVQAAKTNLEETINKAKAYSNRVIPIARGKAEEMIQKAEGYEKEIVAKAEGEAKRFLDIYQEYQSAKEVTRNRIYLETMESILQNVEKILLDPSNNNTIPYLSLNELTKKQK